MRLVWHGHSCFELDDGNVTVVVDPHDGRSLGIAPPSVTADFVLITHDHYDHSATRVVLGEHTDIIGHEGKFSCGTIEAEGFPSFHDGDNGGRFGLNTIYLMVADGISICHCGDIGVIPSQDVMERLEGCDVLIVPAGEVNTMDMKGIAELISAISPKVVVPMHYHVCGLSIPLRNLERFAEIAGDRMSYVGQEMDISQDELPSAQEFWVFNR